MLKRITGGNMNVKPVNGYKKPLYALGVTATAMAVSLTGCADLMKLGPDRRESFFNHLVLRFKTSASS